MNNIQILNAIRTSGSQEYVNRIPLATKENFKEVGNIITTYPTTKNEFVGALTNLVGRTIFLNKLYNNPFKFFKKGTLEYGKTIESVFVDLIKGKSFNENFGTSDVSSLISTQKDNNVKVEYYSENYKNKYKISISDTQLKGALRSQNGLSELIQKMTIAPLNSAEFDEFLMVKQVLNNLELTEVSITGYTGASEEVQAKKLTKTIKTYINKMRFLSDAYNKQGVHTFSMPNELVVLVTPETKANLDVELLSSAFNMSKAEIESRLILIDSFTKQGVADVEDDTETLAIVCDENLIQFYETENSSESFRNADTLTTNTFYHRWGIMAGCNFVNAIKIKGQA